MKTYNNDVFFIILNAIKQACIHFFFKKQNILLKIKTIKYINYELQINLVKTIKNINLIIKHLSTKKNFNLCFYFKFNYCNLKIIFYLIIISVSNALL